MERSRDEFKLQDQELRSRLASKLFWENVAFFLIGTFIGYFLLLSLTPLFYAKEDKERIKNLERVSQEFLREQKLDLYFKAQEEIKAIKDQYSTPYSPFIFLFKDQKNETLFVALSFLPAVLFFVGYYFLQKQLKKIDQFFYPVATKEPPLPLPKEVKYSFFAYGLENERRKKLLSKTFKNLETLIRIMNGGLATDFDEKKARKRINQAVKKVLCYAKKFYPFIPEEEYAFYLEVLFWHYVISLNGNVPTGLMAVYVKSPTLKKMLSLYQRKLLPVIYRAGKVDQENFKPYVYLRALYESLDFEEFFKEFDPLRSGS